MPRPLRPDVPDALYHVMNRGIDHGRVFFDDGDRVELGQRFADIHDQFGVVIHAYCLMDNHYHALLECPDGGLSAAMQRLGSLYTRHVNDRLGRDGALFRGRFASRRILDDEYLQAACRYIHRNPLALDGVDDPAAFRWSSHRTYLGLRRMPPWLRTDMVLRHWDGDRDAFARFVSDETQPLASGITEQDVQAMVSACAFVLDEFAGDASTGRSARLLALAWATEMGVDRSVVMDAVGIASLGALHSAVHRAKRRISDDLALATVIEQAASLAIGPARSRLGSDPWRDQRAARAAS